MRYHLHNVAKVVAVLLLNSVTPAVADVASTNLEGINRTIMEMLRQIKTLQNEVQQLRGEVELNAHTLNTLKTRPRETPNVAVITHPASPALTPPAVPQLPAMPMVPLIIDPPVVQAPRAPTVAAVVTTSAAEQNAYDNAFGLLRSGSYDEAVKSFRDFLAAYPKGQLAANSQYWVGEAYYVTRRFKEAMPEFQYAVENYPDSSKTGDALLKIGYIQYELNQTDEAIKSWETVVARFPQSTAAKLATSRLAKIRR